MSTKDQYDVLFAVDGVDPSMVTVRRFSVVESLSPEYRVEVDVVLPGAQIEPQAWLLGGAAVVILRDGEPLRHFAGVVTSVGEEASPLGVERRDTHQHIAVVIESPFVLLRHTRDYRLFQEMTSQDIASTIFDEAGLSDRIVWRITGTLPEREVCTQYGETGYDFLLRLMAEDGIFGFVEVEDGEPRLVLADGPSAYVDLPEVIFREERALIGAEAIHRLDEIAKVRPGTVTLRDHDFKRPGLLEVEATSDAVLGLEEYDFPGGYTDASEGSRRAQARVDAWTAASVGLEGMSTCFRFSAGHAFSLVEGPGGAFEERWVIRNVTHRYAHDDERQYENIFHLLPATMAFRSHPRPRALVPGPQLATVTGPAGEEIHCDEFGRIKVKFPFDRAGASDDTSSAWVRVTQMHTSGSVAIPRVGWEVLVDFEDGNPDRPVVLGRLYNGTYRPPYPLPGSKTQSSLQSSSSPGGGGHNEIRIEDAAGSEHVHIHAEKDQNLVVANDKTEKVATDAQVAVGANHTREVGANETITVGDAHQLTVGGGQTWSVGASRTKTVNGGENITVKGDRTWNIGGSHTTMTPMSVGVSTPATLSETVGGSCLEVAALEVGIAVAGATTISVGGAKVEACATGKSDTTLGAKATTVGGALVQASGADVGVKVGGAKATTVGGAWAANAASEVGFESNGNLTVNVGGAVSMNGAKILLKVGGSSVAIGGGSVVIKSSTIKLTATGPQPELVPVVEDK